jgi:hypothetical protein
VRIRDVIWNFIKPIVAFALEKSARDMTNQFFDQGLDKSIALVTESSLSDAVIRTYLYEQRKALLRLRIWLLNQNHAVQGKTYVTATDLQGSELKSACLVHLKEAQDLLVQVRVVLAKGENQLKVKTGLFEVSSRAYLSLQFNGFVFSPKALERLTRWKS